MDTASLVMTRELPEEVLKWVQQGWIPMEEQEIMRSLLYECSRGVITRIVRDVAKTPVRGVTY